MSDLSIAEARRNRELDRLRTLRTNLQREACRGVFGLGGRLREQLVRRQADIASEVNRVAVQMAKVAALDGEELLRAFPPRPRSRGTELDVPGRKNHEANLPG